MGINGRFDPPRFYFSDRLDEACWLWGFEQGRRFVEAHLPANGNEQAVEDGEDPDSGPKLLGP